MIDMIGTKFSARTGSFKNKFIPSFFVIVEDELAKYVVDCIYESDYIFPRTYVFSGVWSNQASCLFGFFTYGTALSEMNIPSFGIAAIDDGDVEERSVLKRARGVIKGDHKNDGQKRILEMISESIMSFTLEFKPEKTRGLPEYNHKKWLEEITEEKILKAHKDGGRRYLCDKREVSSMLELVDFSKSIPENRFLINGESAGNDYHDYYSIIESEFRASNTDTKMNNIIWYVLSCIKNYNPEKWIIYTSSIDEKMRRLYEDHKTRFLESNFDFRV